MTVFYNENIKQHIQGVPQSQFAALFRYQEEK